MYLSRRHQRHKFFAILRSAADNYIGHRACLHTRVDNQKNVRVSATYFNKLASTINIYFNTFIVSKAITKLSLWCFDYGQACGQPFFF